ncbi:quinon protein alcohol dehydrogenase-like superfamily [Apodospora peruviana]|uniref:Quinon protein alcohol dehydrogenase-like superfamily n=1 Tax=Apodospora peruviana TaxID=516989 RepID=A0AAE0HU02_9PEZI|nr:quinon protein alcohol dehydrogenase-like superfamily [Apodospora peruviana]
MRLSLLSATGHLPLLLLCTAFQLQQASTHSFDQTPLTSVKSTLGHDDNGDGWGAEIYNNRWAGPDATVDVANIGSLAPFCEKKYNPGVSASPLVFNGIAYYPTWSGLLVALNYRTCETVWRTNISRIITEYQPADEFQRNFLAARATPVMDDNHKVLYLGTLIHALLLAIDMKTGKLIDSLQLSDHPFALLTQSPTFYDGRLYQGVSSLEEGAPQVIPGYRCCTFRGSMNAATLKNGRLRLLWSRDMVPPDTNISGSAIWGSQPSIDPIRRQVFIATGNTYALPDEFEACQNQTANITAIQKGLTAHDPCLPRNVFQESVLALDLESGRINWVTQLSALDAWNVACVGGILGPTPPGAELQCPDNPGPDADFGMAPAFVLGSEHTPDGLDIVVIGQKNGNLYALSAQTGMTLWAVRTGPGGLEGGHSWGMAVDDAAVYYTAINSLRENFTLPLAGNTTISNSAFGAARLKDGKILWETQAPGNMSSFVVPAVVNDVVLNGVTGSYAPGSLFPKGPGALTPLDKRTGKVLEFKELDSYFHGVIAVVHEYVMFGTGYGGLEQAAAGSFQVWKLKDEGSSWKGDDGEL